MNAVSTTQIIECVSNLTNSRARTGFDNTSLEKLEQLFRKTVGDGKEIKRDDFKKIVISKNVRILIWKRKEKLMLNFFQ